MTVTGNYMAQSITVSQILAKGIYQIVITGTAGTKLQQVFVQ
jgi:hypothetical protein